MLDHRLPFPNVPVENGEGLFLGYLDLTSFPQHTIPMALCHMLGRTIDKIGPHMLFFTDNEDVTMYMHRNVDESFAGMHGGQIDLRGIQRGSLTIKSESGNKDVPVSVWKKMQSSQDEPINLPPDILNGLANGLCLYAEIQRPTVQFESKNAFTETWCSLLQNQIIPFDIEARRNRFASLYEQLDEFITKWESLRGLGIDEIHRRFSRTTHEGHNERL